MMNAHTVFVVTLVSQVTTTLVLTILAVGDRRTRGLTLLALACALHTVSLLLIPHWQANNAWAPRSTSAAILPLMFLLIQHGLMLLCHGSRPFPRRAAVVTAVTMLACLFLAPWHLLWSLQLSRLTTIGIIAWSVVLLWRTEPGSVRLPARATAFLLGAIGLTFAVRVPLEPYFATHPVSRFLHGLVMVEITLLAFSFLATYLGVSQRRLTSETRLDVLTGLLNRRALEERAEVLVKAALRNGRPFALLMMDLDAFKLLNDTFGHSVGDRALQAIGAVLLRETPKAGTVARLGGEEFAILLPGFPLEKSRILAEQLRAAIARIVLTEKGRPVPFTASIGVAGWHSGETSWNPTLQRADAALYRAKNLGRNRVAVCETAATLLIGAGRFDPLRHDTHNTPHWPPAAPTNTDAPPPPTRNRRSTRRFRDSN